MVDEYQDTNYVQEQILLALAGENKIYVWWAMRIRHFIGSEVPLCENILEFTRHVQRMQDDNPFRELQVS